MARPRLRLSTNRPTALLSLFLVFGGIQKLSSFAQERSAGVAVSGPSKLLREGSRIEKTVVTFRAVGDRLTVQLPDQRIVTALENLAAQRILKAVIEDPKDDQWAVIGSLTEFNDRNFLLLEHVKRGNR